jgi:glycosyltransferase involved in cell wall biosynthesis
MSIVPLTSVVASMHVGLDLGACIPADGGIGRYVEGLTRALLAQAATGEHTADELVLFTGGRTPPWLSQSLQPFGPGSALPQIRVERYAGRGHATIRANVFLGPRLARMGVQLFHSPDTLGFPLTSGRRVALVATIHDLIPWIFPQTVTRTHRWIRCTILPLIIRRADRLIVDSLATAQDLLERFPESKDKVRVVYLGVDPRFAPAPAEEVATLRSRFGLPPEYLLYLGTLSPRKNLDRLFEAYAILRQEQGDVPPLVIAGKPGWLWEPIIQRVRDLRLETGVTFCGFVPDTDLPALLTGAIAFLLPSLYEGFGLPILEAMACGTPVLTSNRSSLPEVGGDAALFVDPMDPAAIAEGIRRLVDETVYRENLARRGLKQAHAFRWEDTARRTFAVYHEALDRH